MTRTARNEQTVAGAASWAAAELAAAGCVSPWAEARWLLEEALGTPLPGRGPQPLPAGAVQRLEAMVARRAGGEPLQYVVGWAPFGPLRLRVGPGVFVPRPETEGLAERAAVHLRAAGPEGSGEPQGGAPVNKAPLAVDLCTGCGAIACFLAAEVPGARVVATELDPQALAWAQANTASHGIELLAGDLDGPLPAELAGRVDVLCANVPYVPTGAIATLPRDVRDREPRLALDGGPDGLDVLRRVVARAGHWLAPGGWLVCEIGDDQGGAAVRLLASAGLTEVAVRPDLAGSDRVIEGRRRGPGRRGPGNPGGVPRSLGPGGVPRSIGGEA